MVTQIFGRKKSKDTQKAVRFFKERKIPVQLIDVDEKMLSKGELQSILRYYSPEELIDKEAKIYKKRGYAYMDFDPLEEIFDYPELLKVPILRKDSGVLLGFDEQRYRNFITETS